MRITLKETNQKEEELRLAQDELITGMSHDLRTPLTGLMTYLEILKQQEREKGTVSRRYIDKAYNKSLEIRRLSNQLFEFFLARKEEQIELEKPQNIEYVFSDYLSEMTNLLESSGFRINVSEIEWQPVKVCVNMDYIGRIVNNILSNIQKYASADTEIQFKCLYKEKYVGIAIINGILSRESYVEGTGIGTKNIELMMRKMDGKCVIEQGEKEYKIVLWFKEYKCV